MHIHTSPPATITTTTYLDLGPKALPAILGHVNESLILNVPFIRKGIVLYQSLVDFWNVDVCSHNTAMKYMTTAHVCHSQLHVKKRFDNICSL